MNVRAALAPVLLGLLLTGCAAGQERTEAVSAPASAATPPSASSSAAAGATPSATPSPSPAVRTVSVAYSGGEVTGTSGREEVPVGEPVVLRIASDVAEEVHVHGYDLEVAVPAGGRSTSRSPRASRGCSRWSCTTPGRSCSS